MYYFEFIKHCNCFDDMSNIQENKKRKILASLIEKRMGFTIEDFQDEQEAEMNLDLFLSGYEMKIRTEMYSKMLKDLNSVGELTMAFFKDQLRKIE